MPSHLTSNDEVLSIRGELHQLDVASQKIKDKRVTLLRWLNTLESATGILPPEILSLIFQLACASDFEQIYDPLFPVALGSVSHVWRQVAWSTPQLWTTLILEISGPKAAKFAVLLDLYLTNVRSRSIALEIEFDSWRARSFEEDPVAQVFFKTENLKKLGELRLLRPPFGWLCYFDGPFSQLVAIHLADSDLSSLLDDTTFLANAPRLREITLENTSPPSKAPWSSITTLKLSHVSPAIAVQCLLESPNLVEFHYDSPSTKDVDDEEPEIPSFFTLHHLKTFSWSFRGDRTSDLFLHRIRLPALCCLTWDQLGVPLHGIFPSGISNFFRYLSHAPLTTLRLCTTFCIGTALAELIFHQNPRIECLILEDCDEGTLRDVFALLTPRRDGEGQSEGRQYLEKLKVLEVKGYSSYEDYYYIGSGDKSLDLGDVITDLLIGRASGFETSFCVNIDFRGEAEIEWWPVTKETLQEFNSAGTKVRLLECGEQVDWL